MIYLATLFSIFLYFWMLKKLPSNKNDKIGLEIVKSFLPQTACRECGYDGCEPYAKSLFTGEKINLCAMGGTTTFNLLREYFSRTAIIPQQNNTNKVKIVDEKCIGCTRCIKACPVDAIVGAPKLMHSVIEDICNGCGLCLSVCPTDCIEPKTKIQKDKPYASLGCISCGLCNSVQNPNMDKVYALVEAGDSIALSKLNLNGNENIDLLNSKCPVGLPVFEYLNYAIYLADQAMRLIEKSEQNLRYQKEKLERTLKPKPKFIKVVNLDDGKNTEKNLIAKAPTSNLKNKLPVDMQKKLANLKSKVENNAGFKILQNFEDTALQAEQNNSNIAKNVAKYNLQQAKRVLNNLLKASDSTADRIKRQKLLVSQAEKQLQQIENEFIDG